MSNQKPRTKKPRISSNDDTEIDGNVSDSVVVTGSGNVINVGGKSINILIAILFIIGVLVAAILIINGNSESNNQNLLPVVTATVVISETITTTPTITETVPPSEPTSTLTPIPVTETPMPSSTPIQPAAVGQDWLAGCISTLWKIYPSDIPVSERGDGCWTEPVHIFSAENGDLDFLSERESGLAEIYGLFAPLPDENGVVTITVRLKDLENADLWMGIFAEPDLAAQGLLMTILHGDVNKRSFVQKDPRTYETIQGTVVLDQGNGYSISFIFTNLSVVSRVNPSVFVTNPVSIPSTQKWLFLGYKGLSGYYRINGTFLNFRLEP